jgi:hypothetical protein
MKAAWHNLASKGCALFSSANSSPEDPESARKSPGKRKQVKIAVQTLDGQTWDFVVSLRDNVTALKKQIAEREGVAFNTQKLYLEADEIEEHKSLGAYNLKKGDTLMLIVDDPLFDRGQRVRHQGTVAFVQYVTASGTMDLRVVAKSGQVQAVHYGIDPTKCELLETKVPDWWIRVSD